MPWVHAWINNPERCKTVIIAERGICSPIPVTSPRSLLTFHVYLHMVCLFPTIHVDIQPVLQNKIYSRDPLLGMVDVFVHTWL